MQKIINKVKKKTDHLENLKPLSQIYLFGYNKYFQSFKRLFDLNKLPKVNLLSGYKGIGKFTFSLHFVNFLLSKNENHKYDIDQYKINPNNKTYNLINSNTHPNFFLVEKKFSKKNIEIDQIRQLREFLNKTTYNSNIRIILIDEVENLNQNAINALLKSLEEPSDNTYFLLTHNTSTFLSDTIKSRCCEFKFLVDLHDKKLILTKLLDQHNLTLTNSEQLISNFNHASHGDLLNYVFLKLQINDDFSFDNYKDIINFIDYYLINKNNDYLKTISFLIDQFYYKKSLSFTNNSFFIDKRYEILKKISLMKNLNLDERNIFFEVKSILNNEKR